MQVSSSIRGAKFIEHFIWERIGWSSWVLDVYHDISAELITHQLVWNQLPLSWVYREDGEAAKSLPMKTYDIGHVMLVTHILSKCHLALPRLVRGKRSFGSGRMLVPEIKFRKL